MDLLYQVAKLSHLILKDDGSFFLNIGGILSDPMLPFEVVYNFKDAGYKVENTIQWIKSISIEKEDVGKSNRKHDGYSVGHFKPIINERILPVFKNSPFISQKKEM